MENSLIEFKKIESSTSSFISYTEHGSIIEKLYLVPGVPVISHNCLIRLVIEKYLPTGTTITTNLLPRTSLVTSVAPRVEIT